MKYSGKIYIFFSVVYLFSCKYGEALDCVLHWFCIYLRMIENGVATEVWNYTLVLKSALIFMETFFKDES